MLETPVPDIRWLIVQKAIRDRISAIHWDTYAGHEVRSLSSQIDGCPDEILGITPSTRGGPSANLLTELLVWKPARQIGLISSGKNGIDLNAMDGKFHCQRPGEADNAGLRCRVIGKARWPEQ